MSTPNEKIPPSVLSVKNLEMRYGSTLIQQNLNFEISQGDIFIIMGGSGCGKSTLLKHLIGLVKPAAGNVYYGDKDFWASEGNERDQIMQDIGILYQQGALWSSLTLAENVAVPLQEYTALNAKEIRDLCAFKLQLVGLAGFDDYYPSEISGGMRKRAALARAIALDPKFLFFDEPSAGLDPVSAKLLDDLILELRDTLGATIAVVTHELASIYAIGSNSVFLDPISKTMIAQGNPTTLLNESRDARVHEFLTRGNTHTEG
ncbi:ATP-binding cassette domain-containing protein [Kiritimatiellaeota bacterium B1221]|nr:ATP-binding cassette domain-containing protein [Kiritimatiellaeota bacterium B1221]